MKKWHRAQLSLYHARQTRQDELAGIMKASHRQPSWWGILRPTWTSALAFTMRTPSTHGNLFCGIPFHLSLLPASAFCWVATLTSSTLNECNSSSVFCSITSLAGHTRNKRQDPKRHGGGPGSRLSPEASLRRRSWDKKTILVARFRIQQTWPSMSEWGEYLPGNVSSLTNLQKLLTSTVAKDL